MAAYRNLGLVNSPNTNNNNNSGNPHHIPSTLNRDGYDYSSSKYNHQQNYKSVTMPKTHYQISNTTTRDYLQRDDGTNYLTASATYDAESNSSLNEPTKRINHANGKFSIQKMIRHGFSSWRTRKKPSSATTTSPSITSTHTVYANSPTPPPPPLSTGRYVMNDDDYPSQIPPPTAVRSISVDSISNNPSPKRIIVTEPVNYTSTRANSVDSVTVDFDRPTTATRAYMPSPWTNSSTSTTTTNMRTTSPPTTTEPTSQLTPVPTTRIVPVHFTGNSKIPVPRSTPPPPPPPSASLTSPPPRPPSAQTKITETNNSTTPIPISTTNPSRIPPPGKTLSDSFKHSIEFFLVAPKPDPNRITPNRSNYSNNNNFSSSSNTNPTQTSSTTITLNTTPYSSSTTTTEQRSLGLPEKFTINQFKPISETNTYANVNPTPPTRSTTGNHVLSLQEKFQIRSSPVNTTHASPSPVQITTTINTNATPSTMMNASSSPSTNSSSTPTTTVIQTNKQITIQDIDTTKYEEIPAKEPDLTRRPEKSALKKSNAVKRRVIPVLRENQRPSPRPSPKIKPVVLINPPTTTAAASAHNDEQNSDHENEHFSSDNDDDDDDDEDNNNEPRKRFANVKRNDSLARFLKDRPLPNELFEKHILVKPVDERKNERETIETKLERKLSLRPSHEELEARNILRAKTQAELIAEKEETKRYLIRKLSFRPSIQGNFHILISRKYDDRLCTSFLLFRTS